MKSFQINFNTFLTCVNQTDQKGFGLDKFHCIGCISRHSVHECKVCVTATLSFQKINIFFGKILCKQSIIYIDRTDICKLYVWDTIATLKIVGFYDCLWELKETRCVSTTQMPPLVVLFFTDHLGHDSHQNLTCNSSMNIHWNKKISWISQGV